MTNKYKLLPEAEKDLENIWHYTVRKWGVEQALFYIDQLDGAFQLLASNPLLSREYDEFEPPIHIHHHKKYLIVYLLNQTQVLIVRILHESMDVDSLLNS